MLNKKQCYMCKNFCVFDMGHGESYCSKKKTQFGGLAIANASDDATKCKDFEEEDNV